MKIYTKTGDNGETGLLGGVRISKAHDAIKMTGALDETNSHIGLVRSESLPDDVDQVLKLVQNDLFDLGSRVAACLGESNRVPDFPASRSEELEAYIDQFDAELPPLKVFILPGGNRAASLLHITRSVCRRTESQLVDLIQTETNPSLSVELIYLNRLSDLLFVLARLMNVRMKTPETNWDVGRGEAK